MKHELGSRPNQVIRSARVEAASAAAMRVTLSWRGSVPPPAPHDPLERRALKTWLKRAIRAERARGLRGDWAYDLNRHIALAQALRRLESDSDDTLQERRRGG